MMKDETKKEPTANVKEAKKIEVSEEMLRELINSNNELKKTVDRLSSNAVAQSPNIQVRRKNKDSDYKVRKWENGYVIGFVNKGTENRPVYVYGIYNPTTRAQEQFVDLITVQDSKGTTKTHNKVDYISFLRDAEVVKCRMVEGSKEEKEEVKEYGLIPKKEMAENGYGMYETMVMVPVEVVSKTFKMDVKLPEDEGGFVLSVKSEWVNL